MTQKDIFEKTRIVAVPVIFSFGAIAFWLSFREEGSWWWIVLILAVFLSQYGFYEWKNWKAEKEKEIAL